MNTNEMNTKKIDKKALLSTLWIVVMFSVLKADILSLFLPGTADELAKNCFPDVRGGSLGFLWF